MRSQKLHQSNLSEGRVVISAYFFFLFFKKKKNIVLIDIVLKIPEVCFRSCLAGESRLLTPFFPGMAHSQFIRFIVPSGFLVGTATKP